MKLTGPAAARAAQRDLPPRFVMLSGPDAGVLRRTAMGLAARHLATAPELELRRFGEDDLRTDPACVETAISAASLFGGAAIAHVRVSSDKDALALASLLEKVEQGGPMPAGVMLLDVGDITRSSKARKLFEDAKAAWSLQFYEPTRDDLIATAREQARDSGVTIALDALGTLVDMAAQDTDSVAAEVAKLALYVGAGGEIDLAAIDAVGSGSREAGLDEALDAAFLGQTQLMATRLEQALSSGVNPVALCNGVGRRVKQLLNLRAGMEAGGQAAELVKAPRLGIFWKRQGDVARMANAWSRTALEEVLSATLATDASLKRRGSPDAALVERLLTRIAHFGARPRT